MHWWYAHEGQPCGPVPEAEVVAKVLDGILRPASLVWHEGLAQWTPVRDVPVLAKHLPTEPPPLPPTLPDWNSRPPSSELAAVEAVNQRASPTATSSINASPTTWHRYFARQIDICLVAFPVVFLCFFVIGLSAPPGIALKLQDPGIAALFAIVICCLFSPLAEAVVASIFGNTPGKALFGLLVRSLNDRTLTFSEQLRRAYGVMAYGLGFYVPLISLFTCISQYSQVKKHGSAGYDFQLFKVHSRPISKPRYMIAISAWLLSFFAMFGLNIYDKFESRRVASAKSWTNPSTRLSTTIPGGWEITSEKNSHGHDLYVFTKPSNAIQVVFGSEDIPKDASMEAYVAAFVRSVKESMVISPFGDGAIVAGHGAKVHVGELVSPKAPIEITFVKHGNTVWRTVVVRHGGGSARYMVDDLRTAIFSSIPTN